MPSDPGYYHEIERAPPSIQQVRKNFGEMSRIMPENQKLMNNFAEGADQTGITRTIKHTSVPEYPSTSRQDYKQLY
jgi:hypothetical protein